MSKKITCIKKSNGDHENPYTAITSLTWIDDSTQVTGTTSRVDMYELVIKDKVYAYVQDAKGNKAYLIAEISSKGTKFVKTHPDDVKSDNLLKLPECK